MWIALWRRSLFLGGVGVEWAGFGRQLWGISHRSRHDILQERCHVPLTVSDASLLVGEEAAGRAWRYQRVALPARGGRDCGGHSPRGCSGACRCGGQFPASPVCGRLVTHGRDRFRGTEHATTLKSSREVSGHGTLGDVATPFPVPRSQRKEAWSRASPDAVPRNRLLARRPRADAPSLSSKPMPPQRCAAVACPGGRECSSSSSRSSSSHSSRH